VLGCHTLCFLHTERAVFLPSEPVSSPLRRSDVVLFLFHAYHCLGRGFSAEWFFTWRDLLGVLLSAHVVYAFVFSGLV
jgi:hypothetical protein